MATATLEAEELEGLIQPERLKEMGFPKPERVSVVLGSDHTGEEAYKVYLVFSDGTPDEELEWKSVKPMVRWVHKQIWEADGQRRWPYVRVARESEIVGERPDVATKH